MMKRYILVIAVLLTALACGGTPTPAPETTQVPPPTEAPTEAPTAPPMPGLGETLEKDGYTLAALVVEDPAEPGLFYEPEEGERLVAVEIVVGVTDGEPITSNALYATLMDADGFAYALELVGRDGQLDTVDLARGEKVRGWVAFEIPEGAVPASVKYETGMFGGVTLQVGLQ
jgi:hypothetical protein